MMGVIRRLRKLWRWLRHVRRPARLCHAWEVHQFERAGVVIGYGLISRACAKGWMVLASPPGAPLTKWYRPNDC